MCNFWKCCEGRQNISDFQSTINSSKRLLIFVNPKSGSGTALKTFKNKIFPALRENSIAFELFQTDFAGHAADIISKKEDLMQFNAIVIISGDGLIFEVLNSIVSRKDGEKLLKSVPFAIVPCGSGNGLLSSVFVYREQPISDRHFVNTAIETLSHPEAISLPVNLINVETKTSSSLASFLSIGWGLMADIDRDSESLRTICGGYRFFWGALWKVAMLQTYKARLSFIEASANLNSSNMDPIPVYRQDAYRIEEKNDIESDNIWKGHINVEMPDLDKPVPSEWTTIEEDFLMIYAVSTSNISNTNFYCPEAKLNEQQIHLTYILKKDVKSKADVIKFLAGIESGRHLEFPFCNYVKVQAFRLEPENSTRKSPIVVDGEVIPEDKIQAVVSDLCMRIVSK